MRVFKQSRRVAQLATSLSFCSVLIAFVGLFWLPWYVSQETPVPGESYAIGFSNWVAIAALAVAIAVAVVAKLMEGRVPGAIEWFSKKPVVFPPFREAGVEYLILGGATLVWGNVLWSWGRYLVDPAWAEARGFHNGMDLLALGKVPYRDFFYNYGPATLYLPHWLSSLTGGDMSFETAYLVSMVGFTAVGFASLFLLVRTLALPPRERAITLGLCLAAWATINMGLQYTPLRFYVVPGCIVLLDAWVWRQRRVEGIIAEAGWAVAAAAIAALCCLAVSPEMGIAGTAGILAFAVPLWMAGRRATAAATCVGCLGINAATLLGFPDYLLSVVAFAAGGANFPIYPNIHNLVLVGMSLCVFPSVIAAAFMQPSDRRAPFAMGLAVGGGMMLPAALGRCDPGHVFINTTVPAALMFAAAWARGGRAWKAWSAVYAVVFVLLLQYSYWSHYWGNYVLASQMQGFYDANPTVVAAWKEKWDRLRRDRPQGNSLHWSSVLPYPEELEPLAAQGPIMLVTGNEGNYSLARFLHLQKHILPDYFHAYSQGAVTPSQMDRKVQECLAARFLLIPGGVLAPLQGDIDLDAYERGVQEFLSGLLLYPVSSLVQHAPYLPDTVIAKRLLDYFEPIGEYRGYVVLKKKE
ncbi:MAG: hypothetical protein NTW36_03215 [Planctomycetia bacterium]|nr:hypothetical protein [Planctomycetia bacterium]